MVSLKLNEIHEQYESILVDTCALFGSQKDQLNRPKDTLSTQDKIQINVARQKSGEFFRNFLNCGGEFQVTPKVREEYTSDYSGYKAKNREQNIRRELLDLRRAKKNSTKEQKRLIVLLEDKNLILEFDKGNRTQYEKNYGLFRKLKYKKWGKGRQISEPDFDLLIKSSVLSENGKTALVSNDLPMLWTWQRMYFENGSPTFDFYVRSETDKFVSAQKNFNA